MSWEQLEELSQARQRISARSTLALAQAFTAGHDKDMWSEVQRRLIAESEKGL